ncbi:LysR family transcriptional regulator [Pseudomonas sp. W5-36]|uniref:LysR family transcriptional regulator n=1 Tax=Pseudomonas sp. W5-36 TaxID=3097455 RepID=UPI00397A2C88
MDRFDAMQAFVRVVETGSFTKAAGTLHMSKTTVTHELGVYASPAYLQRAGTPDHPRDLEDPQHRIVGYRWARTGQLFPMVLQRDGERVQVQSRYLLTVDDGNAYLAAGLAGMGALWLPEYMAQPSVRSGELVSLFKDWQLESMPMYVAFPPNRHISIKLRVFIDWVVELMGDGYNSRSHD